MHSDRSSLISIKSLTLIFYWSLSIIFAGYALAALFYFQPHEDFFAAWTWGKFLSQHPASGIYDHAAQHAFLMSMDPNYNHKMPFPYPPLYIFVVKALAEFQSYSLAFALWETLTFTAFSYAVLGGVSLKSWLLLLMPASIANIFVGQNGFLTAAILIGGMRLVNSYPLTGGALLGFLAYKPQFALLAIAALAAAQLWRSLAALIFCVVILIVVSVTIAGVDPWVEWINAIPEFLAILRADRLRLSLDMPTAFSNALALGAGEAFAGAIQATVSLGAIVTVYVVFRVRRDNIAIAALCVASVLSSPYAFHYDLVLSAGAISLVFAEVWPVLSNLEAIVFALAGLLPAALLTRALHISGPYGAAINCVLLATIALRCRGFPNRADNKGQVSLEATSS